MSQSTEPTDAPTTRSRLIAAPLLVGAGGLVAAAALRLRDPHEPGSWGFCPFLLITGQPCPGCGGLRAVNDLTHGDVSSAVGSNALAVAAIGVLGLAWLVWLVRRVRGRDVPLVTIRSRAVWLAVLTIVLIFWAVRLSPWGSALGP